MLQSLDHKTKTLLELADFVEKSDHYDHLAVEKCFIGHYNEMTNCTHFMSDLFQGSKTVLDYCRLVYRYPFGDDLDGGSDKWLPTASQAASCLRHYALTGVVDWNRVRYSQQETIKPPALVS